MDATTLDALDTAAGRDLLARIPPGTLAPDEAVALGTALRRDYPADLVAAALTQHDLRQAAAAKFTRAAGMLFTRAGLEQASSEAVARHRAARFAGARHVADLCTGIGGDLIALAGRPGAPDQAGTVPRTLAVDTDPVHLRLAVHNAGVYGVAGGVTGTVGDVRAADLTGVDAAFVDPARRQGDRRLGPGRSEPPLAWCLDLAGRVPAVGVKAAPGLAHETVPGGWELELIALGRDLKEAVLWSPAVATAARRATVLPEGATLLPAPGAPVATRAPGAFVLDPNPAVTRAGLVEELARSLDAWKLDPQLAFLSTERETRTPFARTLRVLDSLPWHERRVRERLHAMDVGSADIRRRGLAGDVARIHRSLRLRGRRRVTLLMTRLEGRPWCLVCADDHPGSPDG